MEFQNPAAQILVALIPIVAIVFAFVLCFFGLLWKHSETKLRISKGTLNPGSLKFNLKAFSLLLGLCLTGVGLVLSILFVLLDGLTWSLLGGLIPFILGLELLLFYKLNPDFKQNVNKTDSLKEGDED